MFDESTIRFAFGAVAVLVYALLCATAVRGLRSTYAHWWRRALLLFLVGYAFFVPTGPDWQRFCEPAGDAFVVAGAATVWAGARSLCARSTPVWQLCVGPLVAAGCAALDHPASNAWAGGPVFLAATAIYFALSSRATWVARHPAGPDQDEPKRSRDPDAQLYRKREDRTYETLVAVLALAFAVLCGFYAVRAVALVALGPGSSTFVRWFGSGPASLVQILLLVVVAFSTSTLATEQRVRELHTRASRDPLTGVFNRAEFFDLADSFLRRGRERGQHCTLVMADLDRFKSINDRFGHPTGDRVLRAFAQACLASVRPHDLVGRYGGEEFILLLVGASPSEAEAVTARISQRFAATAELPDMTPTASYGIAPLEAGVWLPQLIERADRALYRAKRAGRDRAMHHRG